MDEKNQIPHLALDGVPEQPMPSGLAAVEANQSESLLKTQDIAAILKARKPDSSSLSAEELATVEDFSRKIDIRSVTQLLQYGAGAQSKISQFSESVLSNIRTKDMDEVGNIISDLVSQLKGFSPDQPRKKGIAGFFQRTGDQLNQMKTRYNSIEKNVDNICGVLEKHKLVLLKDIAVLDEMYQLNLNYFKELTMYILAGREKLEQVAGLELPAMFDRARQSGNPEDIQEANRVVDMCNRFDKKLHDLDLTRNICLQMGPQIRLVQNNDSTMLEKIQSSIVNTIPLWKNQMVLALGLAHSKSAIEAQREVTNVTNALLRKNADTLKTSTIETAKESERSIVDVETLAYTNQSLIATLDEVMRIQQEGRAGRRAAEEALARIEDELKAKMLEIRDTSKGS